MLYLISNWKCYYILASGYLKFLVYNKFIVDNMLCYLIRGKNNYSFSILNKGNYIICELNFCFNSTQSQSSSAPSDGWRRQKNKEQRQSESKTQKNQVEDEEQENERKEIAPRASCRTMCPAQELWDRESQNRLHRFEVLPGTETSRKPKGDPLRAVKEYSRPAAGKDATKPSDLRPPDVLLQTVCYLIDEIAGSPSLHPWTEASTVTTLWTFGLFILFLENMFHSAKTDWIFCKYLI